MALAAVVLKPSFRVNVVFVSESMLFFLCQESMQYTSRNFTTFQQAAVPLWGSGGSHEGSQLLILAEITPSGFFFVVTIVLLVRLLASSRR